MDALQITFKADTPRIQLGESTSLRWDVKNADRVTIDQEIVNHVDSRPVTPNKTKTYRLRAERDGDVKLAETTIVVYIPLLEIVELTGKPSLIAKGEEVLITWKTRYDGKVTLDGEIVRSSGSKRFSPNESRKFTLTAAKADKEVSRDFRVDVKTPLRFITDHVQELKDSGTPPPQYLKCVLQVIGVTNPEGAELGLFELALIHIESYYESRNIDTETKRKTFLRMVEIIRAADSWRQPCKL